jgi:hypothetical protein
MTPTWSKISARLVNGEKLEDILKDMDSLDNLVYKNRKPKRTVLVSEQQRKAIRG